MMATYIHLLLCAFLYVVVLGVTAPNQLGVFTVKTYSGFSFPTAVAVDSSNNIYVSDYNLARIVKMSPDGKELFSLTTADVDMNDIIDIAIDSADNIYVVDQYNKRIVKFDVNGVTLAIYNNTTPPLYSPVAITIDPYFEWIYILDSNGILFILSSDGVQLGLMQTVVSPNGLSIDAQSNFYVTMSGANNCFAKYSWYGTLLEVVNITSTLLRCNRLLVDENDHIYITGTYKGADPFYNGIVMKMSANGTEELILKANSPGLRMPMGFAFDVTGNLLVSDSGNNRIVRFNMDNGTQSGTFAPKTPSLTPTSVAVDRNGTLYTFVPAKLNFAIVKLDANGQQIGSLVVLNNSLNNADQTSLAVDVDSNIFVLDQSIPQLYIVSPRGGMISSNKPNCINMGPLMADSQYNIFFACDRRIKEVFVNGSIIDSYPAIQLSQQGGFVIDVINDYVFVADSNRNNVIKYAANGQLLAVFNMTDTSPYSLGTPTIISVDAQGNIYVDAVGPLFSPSAVTRPQISQLRKYIVKISGESGKLLQAFWTTRPSLINPNAVALDKYGNVYVADSYHDRVVVFTVSSDTIINAHTDVPINSILANAA